MDDKKTLEELIEKRNRLGAEMFVTSIQIIAVLILPVALAVYAGNILDTLYGIGKLSIFIASLSALAIGWISVWKIYSKVDKEMSELDIRIKELRIQNGYDPEINIKKQEEYDRKEDIDK